MQGYIKLHRKLMESAVWSDPYYLKIWMYCLMKATHKEREMILGSKIVTLEPGQFITGRNSLADDLNKGMKPKQKLSEKTWYRYLENLEKWQMLTIKKTNKYSVISILKWSEYQDSDHQVSIKSPTDVPQVSTNKNVKNVKNDKELISSSSDERFSEVMAFYQMNLQRGISESPFNLELISQWFDEWGADVLLAAMKVAAKAEAKGVNFTEGVLKKWKEAGVKTIEDARKYEQDFKQGKQKKMKVINGGKQNEIRQSSYRQDYSKYDFTKQGNVSWLQDGD